MRNKKKNANKTTTRKPKPAKVPFRNKAISLSPMTFDQAIDAALQVKPKKHT